MNFPRSAVSPENSAVWHPRVGHSGPPLHPAGGPRRPGALDPETHPEEHVEEEEQVFHQRADEGELLPGGGRRPGSPRHGPAAAAPGGLFPSGGRPACAPRARGHEPRCAGARPAAELRCGGRRSSRGAASLAGRGTAPRAAGAAVGSASGGDSAAAAGPAWPARRPGNPARPRTPIGATAGARLPIGSWLMSLSIQPSLSTESRGRHLFCEG